MLKGMGELLREMRMLFFLLLLQYEPSAQIDCEIQQWKAYVTNTYILYTFIPHLVAGIFLVDLNLLSKLNS